MGTQVFPKRCTAPSFRPMSVGQTAGWMTISLGTEIDLQPRPHCVRRGLSSPHAKGAQQPMSVVVRVAHLSYCHSATAELLLDRCHTHTCDKVARQGVTRQSRKCDRAYRTLRHGVSHSRDEHSKGRKTYEMIPEVGTKVMWPKTRDTAISYSNIIT